MTTLSQLKQSVDSWLIRDDVAVTNADFTQILLIAEANIARDFHFARQEITGSLTFTGRSQDLPSNYLEMRNVYLDANDPKTNYMTPKALRESAVWTNGRAGSFYTLEGNSSSPLGTDDKLQMTIAGPASGASPLTVDINYWGRFPGLVDATDTNFVLQEYYDVYLYACLRAAAEYIQEDSLEDRYQAKYDRLVEKQGMLENRKRRAAMPKQAYGNPRAVV